jgi:hypothetical protein
MQSNCPAGYSTKYQENLSHPYLLQLLFLSSVLNPKFALATNQPGCRGVKIVRKVEELQHGDGGTLGHRMLVPSRGGIPDS